TGAGEGDSTGEPVDPAAELIEDAKHEFPTYLDLHEKVVTRTCSPNGGVCHNEKEYPDLHTPQTMLSMLDAPCNLAETDPLNLFDGCEPPGDELVFTTGSNTTYVGEVAWIELVSDKVGVVTHAVVQLRAPIPNAMLVAGQYESIAFQRATDGGMLTVGAVDNAVSYAPGMVALQINGYAELPADVKTLLESDVRAGDPNRNGAFGYSEDEYRLLLPGDPWKSYLLQRLQGNVPGSPMPLANQPLSSAEIIALACWIEGATTAEAASPYASIDYDGCEYAAEFGETPTGSGATFSGHVQPILDARCATAGCHGEVAPAAGLALTAEVAYDSLMAMSLQNPEMPRVTPGNPSNSYLVTKLTGNGLSGMQMPLASQPLSDEELTVVRTWISYGAPND
ncbi:MAG: hypothetical protein IAG13_33290, partial [Deltaproteobacteria bacterium]|nr:hypothetical protein [Nannocystaceae bacterium]